MAIVLCNDIESDMYVYSSRLREMIDGIENINCVHEEEKKEEWKEEEEEEEEEKEYNDDLVERPS